MNTYFKKRLFIITSILFVFITLTPFAFSACSNPEPQPPWPNMKVYNDDSQKIIVDSGDEFIIRYTTDDIYVTLRETYDDTMITLLDKKFENPQDLTERVPTHRWFLFKALRTGETQITINYFTHLDLLVDQKIFNVIIN